MTRLIEILKKEYPNHRPSKVIDVCVEGDRRAITRIVVEWDTRKCLGAIPITRTELGSHESYIEINPHKIWIESLDGKKTPFYSMSQKCRICDRSSRVKPISCEIVKSLIRSYMDNPGPVKRGRFRR